ncbi:RsmD family RNA methyltransferase [Candidatus Saccharibacteria bacterium]|nr:RsmD family RNA methyltransferase [Candidatus Saccharibacteria bacterium]
MKRKQQHFVRITGGECKGLKIGTPGGGTHPMGDRERLAMFNILGERVKGNFIADIFAGGGTLGLEALSRGAAFVLFIEKNRFACDVLNNNMMDLGLSSLNGGVLCGDAYRMLATATDRFGIVFADPPYDEYDPEKIKVIARVVADPSGILVLSHPGEAPEMPGLRLVKTNKYAGAHLSFYEHI